MKTLGIIAGNSQFPLSVARDAKLAGYYVHTIAHQGETLETIEEVSDSVEWLRVGEFGKLISSLKSKSVQEVIFAGGISRVKLFGGVKLDVRGASLLAKVRSTKDDLIMRGMASELESEGMSVESCIKFTTESLVAKGLISGKKPNTENLKDIEVGLEAIRTMGALHIGQLVVVKEGVVVAVEAVEGSDATIARGGELSGGEAVVVKCSKPEQDLRFDVPTAGPRTIEVMYEAGCKLLALESGKTIILEREKTLELAKKRKISIFGV